MLELLLLCSVPDFAFQILRKLSNPYHFILIYHLIILYCTLCIKIRPMELLENWYHLRRKWSTILNQGKEYLIVDPIVRFRNNDQLFCYWRKIMINCFEMIWQLVHSYWWIDLSDIYVFPYTDAHIKTHIHAIHGVSYLGLIFVWQNR